MSLSPEVYVEMLFLVPEQKELNGGALLLHAVRYEGHVCYLHRPTILCMKENYCFQSLLSKQSSNMQSFYSYIHHKRSTCICHIVIENEHYQNFMHEIVETPCFCCSKT